MDGARVRPRLLDWSSLVLWPPVCVYAAFVFLSIPSSKPVAGRAAVTVGLAVSAVVIAWSIYKLLAYGFWWLDDAGLRRGHISTLRVPWRDVESYVVGMPPQLPLLLRVLRAVPTSRVQVSMASIDSHRRAAIVLRLRGNRLLPIGLTTKAIVGGPAFRAALLERLAGKERPASSYSVAEVAALAGVAYLEIVEVG